VYWDGTLRIDVNESYNQAMTKQGLAWDSNVDNGSGYDNLLVTGDAPPPSQPDLTIQSLSVSPTSSTPGTQLTATVVVKNNGTATSTPFVVDFYKNRSTPPGAGLQGDNRWTVSGLGAGATTTLTYNFTPASAGTYHGYAQVDTDGAVSENNETNNVSGPFDYSVVNAIVSDSYTAANGTPLAGRLPDIGSNPYSVAGANTPTIQNNEAHVSGSGGHTYAFLDVGVADATMEADWKARTSGALWAGFVVRYSDSNNNLLVRYDSAHAGGELGLYRKVGGSYTALGAAILGGMAGGSTHKLKVEMTGANLKVYWDGTLRIDVNESYNQAMTKQGLAWDSNVDNGSGYDNLLITSGSGLYLLSLPFNPDGSKLSPALVNQSNAKMARWIAQADVPHYEPVGESHALALASMQRGQGYWVRLINPVTLSAPSDSSLKDQPFALPLTAGWNLVGYPFADDMPFDLDKIQVREANAATSISLREAAQRGWADETLWTYAQESGYAMVHPTLPQALRELETWRAYWVRTTRPLELILPAPSRVPSLSRAPAVRRSNTLDEWLLRLVVQGQGSEDACILGVSRSAAGPGEYFALKPPPSPEPGPVLYFPSGQSQPSAVNLRSGVVGKTVWEVEVNPQGASQPLTLTMPNTAQMPRSLKIWLEDTETGQRRYMRTVSSYNVNSNGKPRRFRIIVEPAGAERKLLSALATTGGQGSPVLLSFVLGTEAQVGMEVISPTGKLVTRTPAPVRRSIGLNTMIWDGKDNRGSVLPRGVYLLRVTAMDDEGRTMALARPVTLR
jgi:hypothetical protein